MSKIITAVFNDGQFATAPEAFQWDVGDRLKFEGLNLPESYEVHFANSAIGVAITVTGDAEGVVIPSECFTYGADIYAWVVLTDSNGLYTEYQVTIPINRRARPAGALPPGQQSDDAKTIIENAVNAWLDAHADEIGGGLSAAIKAALLQIAEKVAYVDEDGQTYYDALYDALYAVKELDSITAQFSQGDTVIYDTDSLNSLRRMLAVLAQYSDGTSELVTDYTLTGALEAGTSTIVVAYEGQTDSFSVEVTHYEAELNSISAVYTQSGTVYDTDTLDDLKADLVVTANYSDGTSATVTGYTLSGTLAEGASTITVSYGGKTATFSVTVTHYVDTTLIHRWDFTQSLTDSVQNAVFEPRSEFAPTQDSSGLHFTAAKQEIHLTTPIDFKGKTIEIDVASASFAGDSSYHSRFVILNASTSDTKGSGLLIWRNTGGWAAYGSTDSSGTSRWTDFYGQVATGTASEMYTLISGKTIKLVCSDTDNEVSLYIDGTLVGTVTMDLSYTSSSLAMKYLHIGGINSGEASAGNQFYNVTLTGLRIYNNV